MIVSLKESYNFLTVEKECIKLFEKVYE